MTELPTPYDGDRYVSTVEAGRMVMAGQRTIYRWAVSGRVAAMRTPSGRLRVRISDLLAAAQDRRYRPGSRVWGKSMTPDALRKRKARQMAKSGVMAPAPNVAPDA